MNRGILTLRAKKPKCPYCGEKAELKPSSAIYPAANQDYGMFWVCPGECDAYVGCHVNSRRHAPLGRLANAELRQWKQLAHKAFDPLWKEDAEGYMGFSRQGAYQWLGSLMGTTKSVHIGFMDVNECQQVVEICEGKLNESSSDTSN